MEEKLTVSEAALTEKRTRRLLTKTPRHTLRKSAKVAQRLREIEDHNIAFRLQEEEFMRHYNRNREDRRLVSGDTRRSMQEQANEDENARRRRLEEIRKITESDEEMALRLQREFEEEERRQREDQARRDAELAQRLALLEEQQIPSSSELTTSPPQPQLHSALTTAVQGDPPLVDLDPPASLNNPASLPSDAAHTSRPALQPEPPFNPFMRPVLLDSSAQGSALLGALHPTNPFLQDIEGEGAEPLRLAPPPPYFHSEFGLPPPSELALRKKD